MIFTCIVNVAVEITHESAQRLPLITTGTASCTALDWLPRTPLTVLVRATDIAATSKGDRTSAMVVNRGPVLFQPQGAFLTVVYAQPINHFGDDDRLVLGYMLCRDTNEIAVVLVENLLTLDKVLDMCPSVEWNGCRKQNSHHFQ